MKKVCFLRICRESSREFSGIFPVLLLFSDNQGKRTVVVVKAAVVQNLLYI